MLKCEGPKKGCIAGQEYCRPQKILDFCHPSLVCALFKSDNRQNVFLKDGGTPWSGLKKAEISASCANSSEYHSSKSKAISLIVGSETR
jgi:hypothetical protein